MVKTSFFYPGLLTNLVHAYRAVALTPDELVGGSQELDLRLALLHLGKQSTKPIGQTQVVCIGKFKTAAPSEKDWNSIST
jgi:hypothetical protein